MTEHTPTPWTAAAKYSSVVGVPIVNQQGKRVGNTAIPAMPREWDHLKRQAEIDAAFIVKAVNNHDALVRALEKISAMDPKGIRADDLGRAASIAREAIQGVAGEALT